MIKYHRIDISESIDVNKANASGVCIICHYWHFLEGGFKFQLDVYNRCHNVLMMSMNLSNIAISNIHDVDYSCIIKVSEYPQKLKILKVTFLLVHGVPIRLK